MKRLALVALAIAALMVAPVLAQEPEPKGWSISRFPAPPAETISAGDVIIAVSFFDGTGWRIVSGTTFQPDWPEPVCPATPRLPERPLG